VSDAPGVLVIEHPHTEGASPTAEAAIHAEVEALLERQRDLEDHMLGLGGQRFRRALTRAEQKGEMSSTGAGVKLLRVAVDPLEAGIRALLDERGKRGPKHLAHRWISKLVTESEAEYVRQMERMKAAGKRLTLDPPNIPATLAFITARTVIDGIHSVTPLRQVACEIAGTLLDELRYQRLRAQRPALFRYKTERLPGSSYSHNKRVLDQTIRWAQENQRDGDEPLDVSDLTMSEQHRLLVGTKLIDIFAETTGLVSVVTQRVVVRGGRSKRTKIKQELYLQATDQTKAWLKRRNEVLEFLTPVNLPTVIPPRRWAQGERGGYHFALRNKYPFVRGHHGESAARAAAAEMPLVYEAVNAIQETAWRVNPHVLALLTEIVDRGRAVGNLALSDVAKEDLPAKPQDIATNEQARKRWRVAARAVHERNHTRQTRALGISKVLLVARQVADEERIYFPCSLDFRGRVYPLTHYLTPQGDDLSKALLTFAEAKPLGEDGAFWLAIHGANCLDVLPTGEKVKTMTMAERATWIQENTKRICQVADDPYADLWWTDAGEPLQFYAFCHEWRGFYEMWKQGRGDEYECSLPVSMDGSCNGLQHFSALLRDPIGGRAVNLTPEDRPQDVYQAVTEAVEARLHELVAEGGEDAEMARRWLASGLVSRKLCKTPTMTFCYGSKRFGMAEQTLDFMKAAGKAKCAVFLEGVTGDAALNEASQWMAARIWEALGVTVVAASRAMAWMQDCARIVVADTEKPLQWSVPVTGFPVCQDYYRREFRQIKTVLAGQLIQPSVLHSTDEVLLHKQVNAVAPNVVHSLDAAALMMTVTLALKDGVQSFGMIHDSYATVPADCGILAHATREAFVRLYRDNDVVAHLKASWDALLPESTERLLPEPPAKGALDINGVLESTYFFS
jgi:DNA-directed RNA polymerase